jgi:outer membrane lipoprotein
MPDSRPNRFALPSPAIRVPAAGRATGRWRATVTLGALLALAACAPLPESLQRPPPGDLALAAARAQPAASEGAPVRWGGQVVSLEHDEERTWVEVLARPLDRRGQPDPRAPAQGRFLARVDRSLDPDAYPLGLSVTVTGRFLELLDGQVGREPYRFAVVVAEEIFRWRPPAPDPWPLCPWPAHPAWHHPGCAPWWIDPWHHPYWYW